MANREKRAFSLIRKLLCGASACVLASATLFGSLNVQAAEATSSGKITINMADPEGAVITDYGYLFLYKVADYNEKTQSFVEVAPFDATTPFTEISVKQLETGLELDGTTYHDISKSDAGIIGNRALGQAYFTAASSASYIDSKESYGGGSYEFTGLDNGLYLITYADATAENGVISEMSPIVISIPNLDASGNVITEVVANPKPMKTQYSEVVPPPPPYYPPEEPTTPPTVPVPPSQGTVLGAVRDIVPPVVPAVLGAQRLPQTGQLWWPVPILAIAGIAMVAAGSLRRKNAVR